LAHPGPAQAGWSVIARLLRDTNACLVLDNCEHLHEACAEAVAALLATCPGMAVLATSQRRLGMAGERCLPVEPLALPAWPTPSNGPDGPDAAHDAAHDAADDAAWRAAPAMQLLLAAVQAAGGAPPVGDEWAQAAALCHRLDGLPLALGLAARRVAVLGWAGTGQAVEQHFRLLAAAAAPGVARHRSLDAAIAWSWACMPTPLQRAWQLLAVFRGGFTLTAAAAVLDQPDAAAVVAELAERSMLQRQLARPGGPALPAEEARFTMHEAQRSHAQARLQRSREAGPARLRHARYLAVRAQQALDDWDTCSDAAWQQRHGAEFENLRSALQGCLGRGEAALAAQLLGAGLPYWRTLGAWHELREAMAHPLLAALDAPHGPDSARAGTARWHWARALAQLDEGSPNEVLAARARAAIAAADAGLGPLAAAQARLCLVSAAARQGDLALQQATLQQVHGLLLGLPAPGRTWGWCCSAQAWARQLGGDLPGALAAAQEAHAVYARCGAVAEAGRALIHVADLQLALDDTAAALATGTRALAALADFRHRDLHGHALANLGAAQARAGQGAAAWVSLLQAVRQLQGLDFSWWVFDHLAERAAAQGRWQLAARCLGFADAGYARHRAGRRLRNEALAHAQAWALLGAQWPAPERAAALAEGAAANEALMLHWVTAPSPDQ
jgi:predicted ATPase